MCLVVTKQNKKLKALQSVLDNYKRELLDEDNYKGLTMFTSENIFINADGFKLYLTKARKDITVYKVLENGKDKMTAPYYHTVYNLNQIYEVDHISFRLGHLITFSFYYGLYSYATLKAAIENRNSWAFPENYTICKAIIPKGSYYLEGNEFDIISDKLMIIEQITE